MSSARLISKRVVLFFLLYVKFFQSFLPKAIKLIPFHLKSTLLVQQETISNDDIYRQTVQYFQTTFKQKILEDDNISPLLSSFVKSANEDIIIESISGGITNHCFKLYLKSKPTKFFFVKHAAEVLKGWSNVTLSSDRLRCEYEGMKTFSKYTPKAVPKSLYYDNDNKYLINEYLDEYVPLTSLLIDGVLDVDCSRAMGTVLGRSHARTHESILTSSQITRFLKQYANEDHFQLWQTALFAPTFVILGGYTNNSASNSSIRSFNNNDMSSTVDINKTKSRNITVDELIDAYLSSTSQIMDTDFTNDRGNTYQASRIDEQERKFNSLMVELKNKMEITETIKHLQSIYMKKKQCLIHADLHSNNIMIKQTDDDDERDNLFKVIDFEKACFGPAGLDLGICLCSYMWYYVAHSNPSVRRNIIGAMLAVIEAYRSAFTVQMSSAILQAGQIESITTSERERLQRLNIENMLNEILTDAMGFMGLYPFFLSVTIPDVEILAVSKVEGLLWGDSIGRAASVRRRQVRMSAEAIMTFQRYSSLITSDHPHNHHLSQPSSSSSSLLNTIIEPISSQTFVQLFQSDDEYLLNDHVTEFWF